jgi:hypothetical protein
MLAAAACAREVSVHIRGGDRPPDPEFLSLAGDAGPPAPPGSLVVSGGVSVSRFRIVVRNLRLQSEPTDGVSDTPGAEFIGPEAYLVDLPGSALGGGVFTRLISNVEIDPKGFYEMDIDLSAVAESDVQAKPALAPLLGKTFVIEGQDAQGTAFVLESSMDRVLLRESVFRIGFNHNNLNVNIASNTWFVGADGGILEPASSDPAVRAQIEENVATSIDAYEDDDMDGNPDPLG